MSRPIVVYLHGFRSSPAGVKARLFVNAVAALPAATRPRLVVPALSHEPATAVAGVAAWIEREVRAPASDLTLIGSSLGGYYVTHLAERRGDRARALYHPGFTFVQPGLHGRFACTVAAVT